MTVYYDRAPNPTHNPDLMESDTRCGMYTRLLCIELRPEWRVDRPIFKSVWKDINNMNPVYVIEDMEALGLPPMLVNYNFWAVWRYRHGKDDTYGKVGEIRRVTEVYGVCCFWASVWPQWHRGANLDYHKLTLEQQARADDLSERWYNVRHFGTRRREDGSIGWWWENGP